MALPFDRSEYAARIAAVEQEMARRGLDALLISDPANMNYLTGYDGWSYYVPQAVVVVGGEEQPYWFGRPQDANGARLTTWLDDEHISSYPETHIHQPDRHPMDVAAQLLERLGCGAKTIGVEMDACYFSAQAYARLTQHLPNAQFQDAKLLVNWKRLVKSPAELDLMRKAARIADHAMEVARRSIAVGRRESDAAAAVYRAEISGVDGIMGDYTALAPLMPSNERTSASHLSVVDRRYAAGDRVTVELAGCHQRYHAPLARTFSLGKPPARLADLAAAVVEAMDSALAAVRPGTSCAGVEAAWRRVFTRHGYEKDSRLGYAVGLGYPPDWGEHTANLRAGDETVLAPNMTFHMIAGMWFDDYGIELSETIAVTETGVEVLTNFERDLLVVEG